MEDRRAVLGTWGVDVLTRRRYAQRDFRSEDPPVLVYVPGERS